MISPHTLVSPPMLLSCSLLGACYLCEEWWEGMLIVILCTFHLKQLLGLRDKGLFSDPIPSPKMGNFYVSGSILFPFPS